MGDTVDREIVYMALCEYTKVYLKPDTLYLFEVVGECKDCVRLAEVYQDGHE